MIPKRPQHLTFINIKNRIIQKLIQGGQSGDYISHCFSSEKICQYHLNNIAVLTVIDLTQKNVWV